MDWEYVTWMTGLSGKEAYTVVRCMNGSSMNLWTAGPELTLDNIDVIKCYFANELAVGMTEVEIDTSTYGVTLDTGKPDPEYSHILLDVVEKIEAMF